MSKKINTKDVISKTRKIWAINPKTRVHDNNILRNKKKTRQEAKAELREYRD